SGIAAELALERRRPPPDIALDLHFEKQGHSTGDKREKTAERRNWMLAGAQPGQIAPAALANAERNPADAQGIRIVKDNDLVVSSQSQVALDAGAKLERGGEC